MGEYLVGDSAGSGPGVASPRYPTWIPGWAVSAAAMRSSHIARNSSRGAASPAPGSSTGVLLVLPPLEGEGDAIVQLQGIGGLAFDIGLPVAVGVTLRRRMFADDGQSVRALRETIRVTA